MVKISSSCFSHFPIRSGVKWTKQNTLTQFKSNVPNFYSRVAGTMVARSSSVRAVARSNLSQVPPLHMHVGK